MLKGEVIFRFNNYEIIEKNVSKFGNSAHITISKEFLEREVKIIAGKSRIKGEEIIIDFSQAEIFNRKVSKFVTGAHIIVSKEYIGKEIKILIKNRDKKGDKNE